MRTFQIFRSADRPEVRTIAPRPCPLCGAEHEPFEAPTEGLLRWLEHGALIGEALPGLTDSQRESMMTGFCDDCWDDLLFTEEAEEDDE